MEVAADRLVNELDGLVTRLQAHVAMAKAYGEAIRRDPALAGGFGKLAKRHRGALVALCDEIKTAATEPVDMGAVVLPFAAAAR